MKLAATILGAGAGLAVLIAGVPDARSTVPAGEPAALLEQTAAAILPAAGAPAFAVATAAAPAIIPAATPADAHSARLLAVAQRELDRLGTAIPHRDRVALVDYSKSSSEPRLFLVTLDTGEVRAFRVTHGKGSDPAHSGRVQSFSSREGSEATSRGAYRTAELYTGQHGRSMRLDGLDDDNRSARSRAIVVHAAAYAEPSVVRSQGRMGRSQGCFALSSADLVPVLDFLGQGRLLFADRL